MRWIIGDLHGMLRALTALLEAIRKRDASPRFMFTGDYVNRGPDSRGVIELLLNLPDARFVRGNHDDIFDLLLHDECYVCHPNAIDPVAAFRWFIDQGLDKTLNSYGIGFDQIEKLLRKTKKDRLAEVLSVVPQAHRRFIRELPAVIEEPDIFVAHAMWNTNLPTSGPGIGERLASDEELRRIILWGRFSEIQIGLPKEWDRIGHFGHTPVINYTVATRTTRTNVPIMGPKIVLVDTGAALGAAGRLTAYTPDARTFIQVDPEGRLVEEDGD